MSERNARRAKDDDGKERLNEAASQYSGTNRSTIGETTIEIAEASMIRREVTDALQQAFPGIQFSTGQPSA